MEALILTCGTGGGHNAAAAALKEEMERRGNHVTMFNPYDLHSTDLSQKIDQAYVGLVKRVPKMFGVVYQLGNLYRHLPVYSPVYFLNGRMAERMADYLRAHPVDVILMTHIFPAQILTYLHNQGMDLPRTVLVATDYTCIPFMEECVCDAYVIPSAELKDEFVGWGIPAERIYPLGIPVSRAFSNHMTQADARRVLGMNVNRKQILIVGGSMGAGKLLKAIELLCNQLKESHSADITVVCGNNKAVYDRMKGHFGDRIRVVGQTNQMPIYLRACDLYLTKAGGLSTTEAAVNGTLLCLLPSIPGCESHNVDFYEGHGMCCTVTATWKGMETMLKMLDKPELKEEMIRCQHAYVDPQSAGKICELADSLVKWHHESLLAPEYETEWQVNYAAARADSVQYRT